jgi:dienelactone hydrolase
MDLPVFVPNLFENDPCPPNPDSSSDFDFSTWKLKHPAADKARHFLPWTKQLKVSQGIEQLAAVGYCYGAKLALGMAAEQGVLTAAYVAHPSFTDDDDILNCTVPLRISAAESDGYFTQEKRWRTESLLQRMTMADQGLDLETPAWQLFLYGGCEHGFATRGGRSKLANLARESAFRQAVEWLELWLELNPKTQKRVKF